MVGATAQGLLSPTTFRCDFATVGDEPALRALLRSVPMEGRIRLTLEREPDFFAAAAIEGDRHYTVCPRDGDHLIAMGSRVVRTLFVNGQPQRVGYLSQLRIHPAYRQRVRQILRAGFNRLRETRAADEAPFDITTIIADNVAARRILTARLPGLPVYREIEPMLTLVLPVRGVAAGKPVAVGTPVLRQQIVDCLQRYGRRHQFAPVWTADDLRLPGVENFHVAHVKDRVIGCLAVWDQRAFKQAVVRGYDHTLRWWRWLLRLPPIGAVWPMAFVSHLAVDDDDPAVFTGLLTAAMRKARRTDCRWLALGLAARHPLANVVREQYRPREYASILYLVPEPGREPVLDGRIPHPEVAVL